MRAFRRIRPVAVAALAAPLVFFTGCVNFDAVPISDSYPVGSHPTPECVRAAKEASYWCARHSSADPDTQFKCQRAQWEHARKC